MTWVAIDFETANEDRSSACQLGVAVVDGENTESKSWLIRPSELYFNPYNVMIHGITEADVENEPELDKLWPEVLSYLEGKTIVAHYASFDISVLRNALDVYAITYPTFDYYCTRLFAKKTWPQLLSYKLNMVADHLGITFDHHHAEADAIACGQIALRRCREAGVDNLEELASRYEITTGRLYPGSWQPSGVKRSGGHWPHIRVGDIKPTVTEFDPDHPFYGQKFVFTGTVEGMPRKEAMQKVVDHGGEIASAVSKKTNFLVVGDQDLRKLKGGDKSTKMKKAEAVLAKGGNIEIIDEDEFLRMLADNLVTHTHRQHEARLTNDGNAAESPGTHPDGTDDWGQSFISY